MKKILILIVAMLLVTTSAFAVIKASKHDLSVTGPAPDNAVNLSSCQFCHTPHHADMTDSSIPLWNRHAPVTVYNVYNTGGGGAAAAAGTTLSNTPVGQPGGHSLTCLSCHDGSIAYGDVILGGDDTGVPHAAIGSIVDPNKMTNASNAYLGNDLRDTHPVGIEYLPLSGVVGNGPGYLAGLADFDAGKTTITDTNGDVYKTYLVGGKNKVECASCHNPHGDDYAHAGAGNADKSPFLRGAKNLMCTTCHSQK